MFHWSDEMPQPKISILVVNWNGRHLLRDCLESLCRQSYRHHEIILVDNGSTDDSVALVMEAFPQVKIVQLSENEGFAKGNLEGFKASAGEYIALLNNDARADEKWLEHLLQPMLKEPRVGICASKILKDGTGEIDSAGDGLTTWGVGFKRGIGMNSTSYASGEYVFGACAAAALYRRSMLEEIGFLDESFFFNHEDTDLNCRAQLSGWKCAYVPAALVHHKVSATIGHLSDLQLYYHLRNAEFLWVKNMPCGLMLRYAHHKLLQELWSLVNLCIYQGRWKPFFRAKRDALKMLPAMLAKRKKIQCRKTVPNSYFGSLLTPLLSRELMRQKLTDFMRYRRA